MIVAGDIGRKTLELDIEISGDGHLNAFTQREGRTGSVRAWLGHEKEAGAHKKNKPDSIAHRRRIMEFCPENSNIQIQPSDGKLREA